MWKINPGTCGRSKMIVTNRRELEGFSTVSHSGLPQGFLHFSSTPLVPINDSELYHIGQWSDNLLQGGWVKNKATDCCCAGNPDCSTVHCCDNPAMEWTQSVDFRGPTSCRLKSAAPRLCGSLPWTLVFWNFPSKQHETWPTQTGMETLWRNLWLLLDGVTSSSAGLLSPSETWNNPLMQIWNLFFCWRSWCKISKPHKKNPLVLVCCCCSEGNRRHHSVILPNSCVHLNFPYLPWHFSWI